MRRLAARKACTFSKKPNFSSVAAWVRELPWASQQELAIVRDDDTIFVLCHYPTITWPHARHGSIHLFGHVHNNWRGTRKP